MKKLEGIREENISITTCSTPTSSTSTSNNKLLANIFDEKLSNNNSGNKTNEIDSIDDLPWTLNELENTELVNQIHDWNFPIFKFYEKSNTFVLSKVILKWFIKNIFQIIYFFFV